MNPDISDLELRLGMPWQTHQRGALEDAAEQVAGGAPLRLCLYHATGKGKTYTALGAMALAGVQRVLVLAPPITHAKWVESGRLLGLTVEPYSHAKFRMRDFKIRRTDALIVDEFHLLGGQTGIGWKKLDRAARSLTGPLVIASATPNYNDAERVYCIMHVLDPEAYKGGFLQFLYRECMTTENPFGKVPNVEGFVNYASAEDYLSKQKRVHYVEDEAIKQLTIADVPMDADVPDEFEVYGLDVRRDRICASQMEARHARRRLAIIGDDGLVKEPVWDEIAQLAGSVTTPSLVFAASSTIAEALFRTAQEYNVPALLTTGTDTTKRKTATIETFKQEQHEILIGTATLATGTDGIDKMCDHLIIVDDTDDDALRRQLMGRILPRGLDSDVSKKIVTRLVFS